MFMQGNPIYNRDNKLEYESILSQYNGPFESFEWYVIFLTSDIELHQRANLNDVVSNLGEKVYLRGPRYFI